MAAFSSAILTGGQSRRMGRDKALLEIDGVALAASVAAVLRAAGAVEVLAIGGDQVGLEALGLAWRADRYPGEGPLGGILTALAEARADPVVVVATDLIALTPATVEAVVSALTVGSLWDSRLSHGDPTLVAADPDVALATTDRLEPLCGAWRRRAAPALHAAFAAGERAVHAALASLTVATVAVEPATLRNVNTPDDLRPR